MTNDEAKFILHAYRPNGRDASDPAMATALAQAKTDPRLGAWFEREQAHAAAMAARLAELAPPAGLRDAILAGAQASQRGSERAPSRAWWRQPARFAIAAGIAVLLGAAAWWRFVPVRGANVDEFAVNFVAHGFTLQKHSPDVGELRAWLAEKHGPLPAALPAEFAQLRALGCRTIDYAGREVSLVCFARGGREFHLFVARRDDFPEATGDSVPRFAARGELASASWSDAKNHYVLVSDAGMDAVKRLL